MAIAITITMTIAIAITITKIVLLSFSDSSSYRFFFWLPNLVFVGLCLFTTNFESWVSVPGYIDRIKVWPDIPTYLLVFPNGSSINCLVAPCNQWIMCYQHAYITWISAKNEFPRPDKLVKALLACPDVSATSVSLIFDGTIAHIHAFCSTFKSLFILC